MNFTLQFAGVASTLHNSPYLLPHPLQRMLFLQRHFQFILPRVLWSFPRHAPVPNAAFDHRSPRPKLHRREVSAVHGLCLVFSRELTCRCPHAVECFLYSRQGSLPIPLCISQIIQLARPSHGISARISANFSPLPLQQNAPCLKAFSSASRSSYAIPRAANCFSPRSRWIGSSRCCPYSLSHCIYPRMKSICPS